MIVTRFNAGSWWPKFRRGKGARIVTADVHKIVGLGTVAFNLIFGVSGAVIGFEGMYRKFAMPPERPAAAPLARASERPPGRVERCVARARELIPGGTVASVTLAHARAAE